MEHTWHFPDGMIAAMHTGEVKGVCIICHTRLHLSVDAWQAAMDAQTLDVPEIHQRHFAWWEAYGSKEYSHCVPKGQIK